MVASEADLRTLLRTHKEVRLHLSFVESHLTASGVPDVAYTINGVTGWLELKYGTARRAPHFRQSQRRWFQTNLAAGGHPVVLLATRTDNHNLFGLIGGHAYQELFAATRFNQWWSLCGFVTSDINAIWPILTTPHHIPIPELTNA